MTAQDEDDRLKEAFMDLLAQGCGTYNKQKDWHEYDHMCMSTYENALQLALEFSWIKEEQLLRKV